MSALVRPAPTNSVLYVGEDGGERRRVALELAPVARLFVQSADGALSAVSDPSVIGALVRVEPDHEAAITLLVELRSRRPTLPILASSSEARRLPLNRLAQHCVLVGTAPLDRGVLAGFVAWLREAPSSFEVRLASLTPHHPLSPREVDSAGVRRLPCGNSSQEPEGALASQDRRLQLPNFSSRRPAWAAFFARPMLAWPQEP